jgi:hypothetical protein
MILRSIIFSLIDLMIRFRPKDGTIVNSLRRVDGTNKWVPERLLSSMGTDTEIWYTFGGKVYRTRTWPVLKTGFVIPWIKSDPELKWFHSYAGPKRDFHGGPLVLPTRIRRFPSPHIEFTGKGFRFSIGIGYLFEYGVCTLTNILNQNVLTSSIR